MIFRRTTTAGYTGDAEPLILTTAALLLAIVFVIPGLFDTTLTSRLAVYPICAIILLYAGRRTVPAWALAGAVYAAVVTAAWALFAPIPLQGVIPSARWISFFLMLAGAAGVYRGYGSSVIWKSITAAAAAAAVVQLSGGSEWIWGNSNRPGVLLALGAVLAIQGNLFKRKYAGILCALLMGAALISTGFITGWIAAAMGIIWGLKPRKWRIHHSVPVFLFLLLQILFTSFPSLAGMISPSLEIRTRIWRT
ncbi:MAG: hypothetical protein GF388_02090, partial [Candidatus Aegiribacteria sp.]|nr:hypothetical protein [Candidatus Aegiribacteria sp.]